MGNPPHIGTSEILVADVYPPVCADFPFQTAKIEANQVADQAQLDAEKQTADAKAAFEKARMDAEKK
jgi:hypothetical protein